MHKVSPLAYRYTLEFLKVINDGFGRAVCGCNGTVMENSKGHISFLQPCAFPMASLERAGEGGLTALRYPAQYYLPSSITSGSHTAPDSAGTAE